METTFKSINTTAQLEIIQEIARKTIDQSYRYFLGDYTVDRYLNSGRIEQYLRENIVNTWGLYLDSKIIGFAVCIDNVIDFMLIDSDYHRQGFGAQLLHYCEKLLFENHEIIALESFETNTHATEFYEANHWNMVEKYRDSKSEEIKLIFRKHKFIEHRPYDK